MEITNNRCQRVNSRIKLFTVNRVRYATFIDYFTKEVTYRVSGTPEKRYSDGMYSGGDVFNILKQYDFYFSDYPARKEL